MKYTDSLELALPRERVVLLASDPELLPRWLLEGTETITRQEPEDLHQLSKDDVVHFDRELVAHGMWSVTRDRFTEIGPEATLWESENEYRFSNRVMRLLAPLLRGSFRKQSLRHMQDFKAFAEHGTDVRTVED